MEENQLATAHDQTAEALAHFTFPDQRWTFVRPRAGIVGLDHRPISTWTKELRPVGGRSSEWKHEPNSNNVDEGRRQTGQRKISAARRVGWHTDDEREWRWFPALASQ